ncbi:MAG TPA: RHS repeat-associated core domain-containing protein, partial [Marmoricola sp.]
TGSDGLTLGYNLLGQTTSIDPAGSVGPITMSYDGVTQDRRASKGTQQYSYGYTGLASQYTAGTASATDRFLRTPDGDLIALVDPDGTDPTRYYLTDGQKSVIATIDTTGTVRRYLYEPYGHQIRTWTDTTPTANTTTGTTPPDGGQTTPADTNPDNNPWRYASGYYDTETGMLKYGTRYYQPTLARWTQPDPEADKPQNPLSLNPYLYANDNPWDERDPTGRSVAAVLSLLGAGIAGTANGLALILAGASEYAGATALAGTLFGLLGVATGAVFIGLTGLAIAYAVSDLTGGS